MLCQIAYSNQQHTLEARKELTRNLLTDAQTLISVRWTMECTLHEEDTEIYLYGYNGRFMVGLQTLKNALGNLADHIEIIRSSPTHNAQELIRYKECRDKWQVPTQVSDSSSGWEAEEPQKTLTGIKRKR